MKIPKFRRKAKENTTEKPNSPGLILDINPSQNSLLTNSDVKPKRLFRFSKKSKKIKRSRKKLYIFLLVFTIIIGVLGFIAYTNLYLPYKRVRSSVDSIQQIASALASDFDKKDLTNLDKSFELVQQELVKINLEIDQFEFLATLDYTRGYYQNFQVAKGLLDKVSLLIKNNLPELKNLLKASGFKTDASDIVLESTEEDSSSISLIMKELPSYLALYKKIEPDIISILNEFKNFDLSYIPVIGGTNYSEIINGVNEFAVKFPTLSDQTTDFLKYLPDLLGSTSPADYLLILQNETEMRSSGGLLTAFGNLRIENGEIGDISLSDMWNLELYVSSTLGVDVGYRNIYGQLYLMDWGCGAYYLRAQDAGIYPDLKLTMKMLSDYYNVANRYNKTDYPDYNKIMILNNRFAENLISLIEPLEVEGFGTVTAESLYAFIKSQTDSVENRGNPDRKNIIKDIANAARKKFLEFKLADMPRIITTMINSINAKDIGISVPGNQEIEEYLAKYGFNGETVRVFDGDYFQLSEAQNCALKINKWLRNDVTQTINIDNSGNISKSVYTKWTQAEVYKGEYYDQYDIGGRFQYRAWVRLLMPDGSTNVSSDGFYNSGYLRYWPREYKDDQMNKYISDNIIQFNHTRLSESDPIKEEDLLVTYNLPSELNYNSKGGYKLLIQKHPGKSWGEKNTVIINHAGSQFSVEFILDRDKVITYQDGIISVDNYNKSLDFIIGIVNDIPWDKLKED